VFGKVGGYLVIILASAGSFSAAVAPPSAAIVSEKQPSVRQVCRSAEVAGSEFNNARHLAESLVPARRMFSSAARQAKRAGATDLAQQLSLVSQNLKTLEAIAKGTRPREIYLTLTALTHGLTGTVLECERAGQSIRID
jgi:hypothetical protein